MEYAAQLGSVYGAEVRPHHRAKFGAVLCRMLGCCCNTNLRHNSLKSVQKSPESGHAYMANSICHNSKNICNVWILHKRSLFLHISGYFSTISLKHFVKTQRK